MIAPKYVFIVNGTPIPVTRTETAKKIESNNLKLKDILEEAKYFLGNYNNLIQLKGVLEAMLPFISELHAYEDDLRNKINLLEAGIASGEDFSIRIDSKRFSVKGFLDMNILEITKPVQRNTDYGPIYTIELSCLKEGRVG
ncbi:MAG: hypothetical protein NDP12_03340 [Crenarchaeota archaeon]|nr:hypothetical protein [Thermoproteota archaeon]